MTHKKINRSLLHLFLVFVIFPVAATTFVIYWNIFSQPVHNSLESIKINRASLLEYDQPAFSLKYPSNWQVVKSSESYYEVNDPATRYEFIDEKSHEKRITFNRSILFLILNKNDRQFQGEYMSPEQYAKFVCQSTYRSQLENTNILNKTARIFSCSSENSKGVYSLSTYFIFNAEILVQVNTLWGTQPFDQDKINTFLENVNLK